MTGDYRLSGLAVPESLDRLHDLLEQVRSDHKDLDENDLSMFETAIVEIHGNVVQHGVPPGEVRYVFELTVEGDQLVGMLADTGDTAPDLSESGTLPDELAESGTGLWLAQAALDELDYLSRIHVADLRAAVAKRGNDAAATALVNRLRDSSTEFAALWDRHEVSVRRQCRIRVQHPAIGLIELDYEALLTPAEDQRLLLFTAPPGSPSVDYLELLRVVGTEMFTG